MLLTVLSAMVYVCLRVHLGLALNSSKREHMIYLSVISCPFQQREWFAGAGSRLHSASPRPL